MNYYNEIDKFAAGWLRELIKEGLIQPGDVDERSIADVTGSDLRGYTQCHFFAGIGGWPRALELAGWPTDRAVWTGSCPCQPLSVAGLGKGAEDERHLWPEFARLICECEPSVVFGEQVASKLGREWLSGVRLDLEAMGYAVGAADLCAAGVCAPHIRQRLFWVADRINRGSQTGWPESNGSACNGQNENVRPEVEEFCSAVRVGDMLKPGLEGHAWDVDYRDESRRVNANQNRSASASGFWSDSIWWPCSDGKQRRIPATNGEVEPTLFPLANGIPNLVGLLRGAGNAIVPQVAAEFIKAFLEVE